MQRLARDKAEQKQLQVSIIASTIGGLAFVAIVAVIAFRYRQYKIKMRPVNFEKQVNEMLASGELVRVQSSEQGNTLRIPREIKRAHINLMEELGHGQFGDVFKAGDKTHEHPRVTSTYI